MLKDDNSGHAADEEAAERADPAVPCEPGQCWQAEADDNRQRVNMSMLPHHQRIFL